jgi:hypothetical protein
MLLSFPILPSRDAKSFARVLDHHSIIYMFFHLLRLYDMSHLSRTGLFRKDHPLYKLRLATLNTAVVGGFFNLVAIFADINEADFLPPFIFSLVLFFLLLVFVFHDLATYTPPSSNERSLPAPSLSTTPTQNADRTSQWPSKRLVIIDLIFALVFQFLFWTTFGIIVGSYRRSYYTGGRETFEAYANLANLVASILYAIAFWKELMARKQQAWRNDVEAEPCAACGHTNKIHDAEHVQCTTSNVAREAAGDLPKPSNLPRSSKITLPEWARSPHAKRYSDNDQVDAPHSTAEEANEQSLLVTPDESTTEVAGPSNSNHGYGTLAQSVESISSVPETIVKKKDKGKKRLVEVD